MSFDKAWQNSCRNNKSEFLNKEQVEFWQLELEEMQFVHFETDWPPNHRRNREYKQKCKQAFKRKLNTKTLNTYNICQIYP